MDPGIIRRCKATTAEDISALCLAGGFQIDRRADSIARALWSSQQSQFYPVMVVVIDVAQERGWHIDVIHDNIDLAVVKQIAKCGAPRGHYDGKPRVFDGRYKFELLSRNIAEKKRSLREAGAPVVPVHFRVYMPAGNENILPPVVVVVDKSVAPAEERNCGHGQANIAAHIGKAEIAFIAIEDFVVVGEGGVQNVEPAVIFVVAQRNPHACRVASFTVHRVARLKTKIFKSPVTFVAVEIVRHRVVGYQQFGAAIPVEIRKYRRKSEVAGRIGHSRLDAHIGEGTVTVVVKEVVMLSFQSSRPAE